MRFLRVFLPNREFFLCNCILLSGMVVFISLVWWYSSLWLAGIYLWLNCIFLFALVVFFCLTLWYESIWLSSTNLYDLVVFISTVWLYSFLSDCCITFQPTIMSRTCVWSYSLPCLKVFTSLTWSYTPTCMTRLYSLKGKLAGFIVKLRSLGLFSRHL